MKHIGTFQSARWGRLNVLRGTYGGPTGPVAIVLQSDEGEPVATLSVNMYRPECSEDSRALPADCFFVKAWAENEQIADEARESGRFLVRDDLPKAESGWVSAQAWQILPQAEGGAQ